MPQFLFAIGSRHKESVAKVLGLGELLYSIVQQVEHIVCVASVVSHVPGVEGKREVVRGVVR